MYGLEFLFSVDHLKILLDFVIGLVLFLLGRRTAGITLFMKTAFTLIEMARHYHDTHPNGKKLDPKIDAKFDKLYEKNLAAIDKKFKIASETNAQG